MDRPKQAGRARLSDVAALAGVSLGSASRALSSPEKVKAKTLQAVRAAVEALGYMPDGNARSLASRRSFTVGVVLPTVDNPIFADFVHFLQQALNRDRYLLLVAAHEYDPAAEAQIVERLLERGIDGLALVGTDHEPQVFDLLARAGKPHLCAWSTDEAAGHHCIGFSNREGMRLAARHLTDLGHSRIAMLSGFTARNERARGRLAGVREVAPDVRVIEGDLTIEAGREGLREVLAMSPRPTALICATDLLAAGALAEAREQGLRMPDDLSVTGFDDIQLASLVTPALTTVKVPTRELGIRTAQAILAGIRGEPMDTRPLEAVLVVRASTAQPRAE